VTDRQVDIVDHYYSWPLHCGGPAKNRNAWRVIVLHVLILLFDMLLFVVFS